MIRRVAGAVWDRIHPAPAPTPVPVPTLAEQRLLRLVRVTRVALRFDLMWTTGLAAEHLEEFDREFLHHIDTGCRDKVALCMQAAAQLEVQS